MVNGTIRLIDNMIRGHSSQKQGAEWNRRCIYLSIKTCLTPSRSNQTLDQTQDHHADHPKGGPPQHTYMLCGL